MKIISLYLWLLSTLIIPVFAGDKPDIKALPLSTVASQIESRGYLITEARHDRDLLSSDEWRMKAMKQERHFKLKVKSKTGAILDTDRDGRGKEHPGKNMMPLSAIAQSLEKDGYLLSEVEFKQSNWSVEAYRDGKKWKLQVSPSSADIISRKKG